IEDWNIGSIQNMQLSRLPRYKRGLLLSCWMCVDCRCFRVRCWGSGEYARRVDLHLLNREFKEIRKSREPDLLLSFRLDQLSLCNGKLCVGLRSVCARTEFVVHQTVHAV